MEFGSLIRFDDLHVLSDRLPGRRAVYVPLRASRDRALNREGPYAPGAREALLEGSRAAGLPIRDSGCYGHVDGPRFNSRAEIRSLAVAGVNGESQAAAEVVLAGEAELPFALVRYATDCANGVQEEPRPVEWLRELIAASSDTFAGLL